MKTPREFDPKEQEKENSACVVDRVETIINNSTPAMFPWRVTVVGCAAAMYSLNWVSQGSFFAAPLVWIDAGLTVCPQCRAIFLRREVWQDGMWSHLSLWYPSTKTVFLKWGQNVFHYGYKIKAGSMLKSKQERIMKEQSISCCILSTLLSKNMWNFRMWVLNPVH